MRFLLGMCALLALPLWADTQVTTKIHDIDHGDHMADQALVFLTSGQVVKLNVNNTPLLNRLNSSLQNREMVTVEINDQREITGLKRNVEDQTAALVNLLEDTEEERGELLEKSADPMSGYRPSVLSQDKAKQLFKEARSTWKAETQCFNRAHIWTYEWRVKHNVYSNKMWIFFTRKYIRRYNFEWWFHVAPMVYVSVDGQVKERVMDRKYSSGPLTLQKWANIFLRDDAPCPYVKKYSEHSNFPEAGSCFFQKSPMYYYQPVDLEFFEKFGAVRNTWREADVRGAYAEAFDIYP